MAEKSHIEWTDATWNIITGCSVHTPGCTNCYAMKLAGSRLNSHPSRAGLTRDSKAGPVWTGEVRFNEQWLLQPIRWRRPRMIFVCAHGDLFHESVPDEWIDKVFAVMALAPQHTFQVLTKRADRMRRYMAGHDTKVPYLGRMPLERIHLEAAGHMEGDGGYMDALKEAGNVYSLYLDAPWPLPNVWLGVSVEDQKRADERIPELLQTPAATRWISAEPLLGPIDWRRWLPGMRETRGLNGKRILQPHWYMARCDRCGWIGSTELFGEARYHDDADVVCNACNQICNAVELPKPDWLVVGGESGPDARPMHPDWAREPRDQCAKADVPFLFKQWGEWVPGITYSIGNKGGFAGHMNCQTHPGMPSLWWSGDAFNGVISTRVGKKAAGRILDGVTHDGFPS